MKTITPPLPYSAEKSVDLLGRDIDTMRGLDGQYNNLQQVPPRPNHLPCIGDSRRPLHPPPQCAGHDPRETEQRCTTPLLTPPDALLHSESI